MAERLNFEIHEPETMTFADQIKLFRESSVVVGLGGAALFNVVFCKPGTTVVSIESSNSFVHNHAALFASLGHKYGFIFGCQDVTDTAPVHKRWSIDVDGLLSVLRGL
jgi:capsular polysaccharide biosynthesis protein